MRTSGRRLSFEWALIEGKIDDVAHLRRLRSYTYCGTNDGNGKGTGHFGATVKARDFFLEFAPPANVLRRSSRPVPSSAISSLPGATRVTRTVASRA